ncbi:trypco2 family protein [Streptomyces phyllanthi]|uniref:Trypsin-co-occurring domain-containing protein n=1 Tax=Streptomyces phyllanthi TaxID=1803180 RepID=A0A5N8W9P8_9ACTN|nr:trypco2 family protein [Streptomyces phyllanthi]MPY43842.1 hypothetical protein [Streptomyces phyllanthi]
MSDPITVKELIRKLSEDLLESERERKQSGRRAVFEVAELTVELEFTVSRSRQGRAGLDLHVVDVGGEAGRTNAHSQRMTLRLVAAGAKIPPFGDDESAATQAGVNAAPATSSFVPLDYDEVLPVRPRISLRRRKEKND